MDYFINSKLHTLLSLFNYQQSKLKILNRDWKLIKMKYTNVSLCSKSKICIKKTIKYIRYIVDIFLKHAYIYL